MVLDDVIVVGGVGGAIKVAVAAVFEKTMIYVSLRALHMRAKSIADFF